MSLVPYNVMQKARSELTSMDRGQLRQMDTLQFSRLGRSLRDHAIADEALFYLTGNSLKDEIGGVAAQLLGGVSAGGAPIAPGLGGSFVFPVPADPTTISAVKVATCAAIAMTGFPIIEFWVAFDRPAPATPSGWITFWLLNVEGGPDYGGAQGVNGPAVWDNVEAELGYTSGRHDGPFADGLVAWSPGSIAHIVMYMGTDLTMHFIVNGEACDPFPGPTPAFALSGLPPSVGDLFIGSSNNAFGGDFTGLDRTPGRISNFALYGGGDTRDVLRMARRNYAAGLLA